MILIDTHLMLWAALAPERLPARASKLLVTRSSDAGFIELDIRPVHVMRVALLPWIHRDPFDRLLVAQALHEGIDLMSADKTLKRYGKVVKSA